MKTTNKVKIVMLAVLAVLMGLVSGCQKEEMLVERSPTPPPVGPSNPTDQDVVPRGEAAVRMKATPLPGAAMVNIEVNEIAIRYTVPTPGVRRWVVINKEPKVYNMLNFSDGIMAILAQSTNLATGQIMSVRVTLGYHNSVVKLNAAGVLESHPLVVNDANRVVVIENVNAQVSHRNRVAINLLFDTKASVSYEDGGIHTLQPVITLGGLTYDIGID